MEIKERKGYINDNAMIPNKAIILLSGALFLVFACTSCSYTRVTVHPSNSSIELTDYQSFDFFELDASGDTTEALQQTIAYLKSQVVREMEKRGLTRNSGAPELKINLGINIQEKTQTRETSLTDPGEWTYIGQRNYTWESRTVEVGTYKEGSLIMHVVDARDNRAIWVGIIEGVMPENPGKRQKAMEKAVKALFEKIDESGGD